MQSKSLFSFPLSELALRFSLCRTSSSSNRLEVVVVQYYIVKLANEQTTKGEFDPPLFSQSVPFTQERSICICGHNHLAQSSNSAFDTINQPAAHEWFCIFGKQYLLLLLLSNKVQTPSAQTIQIQRETSRLLSPYSWWWQWCVYWMLAAEVAAAALSTTLSHVHWTSIHFTLEKETKLKFWKMMCHSVSFTLKKQVPILFSTYTLDRSTNQLLN